MRKIILYSAISLDDFIARKDGNIDWLENPELYTEGVDFGYREFYNSIDTTLMGHATYKQVIGFEGEFPYPDKKNYVFSRTNGLQDTEYVSFVAKEIGQFCKKLKTEAGKDIWLVGGGKINSALLDADLIDELILTRIPVAISTGIPLFSQKNWKSVFSNRATKVYKNGIIQLTMKKY